jgi:broad specificity phosphatase PhoE
MTRLILWRHGQTEWNATERFQGQADIDLDEVGVSQANESASRLADYQPELIVSSDLRRASRTAQALAAITGLPVELDARLRERHFGPWQGLTREQLRERYPADYARWGSGGRIENPAIETIEDVAIRAADALRDIAARAGEGTAVLVSHGGAIRAGCGAVLGWPPEVWPSLGVLGNCRHSELRHTAERGWRLHAHNLG